MLPYQYCNNSVSTGPVRRGSRKWLHWYLNILGSTFERSKSAVSMWAKEKVGCICTAATTATTTTHISTKCCPTSHQTVQLQTTISWAYGSFFYTFLLCKCIHVCNARYCCRLSVCLSVCLSNTCFVTKWNQYVDTIQKRNLSSYFWLQ